MRAHRISFQFRLHLKDTMLFKHLQYIYAAMGTLTLKNVITIFIKMLDGKTFYNENDRKGAKEAKERKERLLKAYKSAVASIDPDVSYSELCTELDNVYKKRVK